MCCIRQSNEQCAELVQEVQTGMASQLRQNSDDCQVAAASTTKVSVVVRAVLNIRAVLLP